MPCTRHQGIYSTKIAVFVKFSYFKMKGIRYTIKIYLWEIILPIAGAGIFSITSPDGWFRARPGFRGRRLNLNRKQMT